MKTLQALLAAFKKPQQTDTEVCNAIRVTSVTCPATWQPTPNTRYNYLLWMSNTVKSTRQHEIDSYVI